MTYGYLGRRVYSPGTCMLYLCVCVPPVSGLHRSFSPCPAPSRLLLSFHGSIDLIVNPGFKIPTLPKYYLCTYLHSYRRYLFAAFKLLSFLFFFFLSLIYKVLPYLLLQLIVTAQFLPILSCFEILTHWPALLFQ